MMKTIEADLRGVPYISGFCRNLFNPLNHDKRFWILLTYKGSDILYESHSFFPSF